MIGLVLPENTRLGVGDGCNALVGWARDSQTRCVRGIVYLEKIEAKIKINRGSIARAPNVFVARSQKIKSNLNTHGTWACVVI